MKFPEDDLDQQTPEGGLRAQKPKKYDNNNNKNEDINLNVNNVNSSQKFRLESRSWFQLPAKSVVLCFVLLALEKARICLFSKFWLAGSNRHPMKEKHQSQGDVIEKPLHNISQVKIVQRQYRNGICTWSLLSKRTWYKKFAYNLLLSDPSIVNCLFLKVKIFNKFQNWMTDNIGILACLFVIISISLQNS